MPCGMCVLHLLTNEELVRFIQKIGHFQAARIIEERKIDGKKILELTERQTFKWHLTGVEDELLWKCIHQLKLNHLTKTDSQRLLVRDKNQFGRQLKEHFKQKPCQEQSEDLRKLVSSMERVSDDSDVESDYCPEYISGPRESNSPSLLHMKTRSKPKKNEGYAILKNCNEGYMDSSSSYLTAIDNISIRQSTRISSMYEAPPILIPRRSTLKEQSSKLGKKSKGSKLELQGKLLCFSCGFVYTRESCD